MQLSDGSNTNVTFTFGRFDLEVHDIKLMFSKKQHIMEGEKSLVTI